MAIKAEIRHIKEWTASSPLFQRRPVRLMGRVIKEMRSRDANHLAAGVSYYAFFSLFPFILGFLAVAGLVLNSDILYLRFLAFIEENLPGSAGFVTNNVDQIVRLSGTLGIIALVGLLWSASAVFGAINRVVNRAWNIYSDGPFYLSKPRQFLMALVLGFLFLIYASATSIIELLMERDLGLPGQRIFLELGLGQIALRALPWVISLSIFFLIYKLVPQCKTYWRYIWPGALTATILFELGKGLFTWYLASIANYTQVYGPLASVMILLFWIYLSALILILGAEICHETEHLYRREE
ncbi:MAG: YihY/virulence factor BrkB family protein [Dehalococcoidia bacterium]